MSTQNSSARVIAALEDVRDAESVEELEVVYEESAELHDVDEFVAAYAKRKSELMVEETEEEDDMPEEVKNEEVVEEDKEVNVDVDKLEEVKALLARMEALEAKIAAGAPRRAAKKVARYKNRGYKLLKTTIDSETPQLLTVIDILKAIGADKVVMSEKDTIESMERNAKLFNITGEKQTATRIFKYYRPALRDAGVIEIVRL